MPGKNRGRGKYRGPSTDVPARDKKAADVASVSKMEQSGPTVGLAEEHGAPSDLDQEALATPQDVADLAHAMNRARSPSMIEMALTPPSGADVRQMAKIAVCEDLASARNSLDLSPYSPASPLTSSVFDPQPSPTTSAPAASSLHPYATDTQPRSSLYDMPSSSLDGQNPQPPSPRASPGGVSGAGRGPVRWARGAATLLNVLSQAASDTAAEYDEHLCHPTSTSPSSSLAHSTSGPASPTSSPAGSIKRRGSTRAGAPGVLDPVPEPSSPARSGGGKQQPQSPQQLTTGGVWQGRSGGAGAGPAAAEDSTRLAASAGESQRPAAAAGEGSQPRVSAEAGPERDPVVESKVPAAPAGSFAFGGEPELAFMMDQQPVAHSKSELSFMTDKPQTTQTQQPDAPELGQAAADAKQPADGDWALKSEPELAFLLDLHPTVAPELEEVLDQAHSDDISEATHPAVAQAIAMVGLPATAQRSLSPSSPLSDVTLLQRTSLTGSDQEVKPPPAAVVLLRRSPTHGVRPATPGSPRATPSASPATPAASSATPAAGGSAAVSEDRPAFVDVSHIEALARQRAMEGGPEYEARVAKQEVEDQLVKAGEAAAGVVALAERAGVPVAAVVPQPEQEVPPTVLPLPKGLELEPVDLQQEERLEDLVEYAKEVVGEAKAVVKDVLVASLQAAQGTARAVARAVEEECAEAVSRLSRDSAPDSVRDSQASGALASPPTPALPKPAQTDATTDTLTSAVRVSAVPSEVVGVPVPVPTVFDALVAADDVHTGPATGEVMGVPVRPPASPRVPLASAEKITLQVPAMSFTTAARLERAEAATDSEPPTREPSDTQAEPSLVTDTSLPRSPAAIATPTPAARRSFGDSPSTPTHVTAPAEASKVFAEVVDTAPQASSGSATPAMSRIPTAEVFAAPPELKDEPSFSGPQGKAPAPTRHKDSHGPVVPGAGKAQDSAPAETATAAGSAAAPPTAPAAAAKQPADAAAKQPADAAAGSRGAEASGLGSHPINNDSNTNSLSTTPKGPSTIDLAGHLASGGESDGVQLQNRVNAVAGQVVDVAREAYAAAMATGRAVAQGVWRGGEEVQGYMEVVPEPGNPYNIPPDEQDPSITKGLDKGQGLEKELGQRQGLEEETGQGEEVEGTAGNLPAAGDYGNTSVDADGNAAVGTEGGEEEGVPWGEKGGGVGTVLKNVLHGVGERLGGVVVAVLGRLDVPAEVVQADEPSAMLAAAAAGAPVTSEAGEKAGLAPTESETAAVAAAEAAGEPLTVAETEELSAAVTEPAAAAGDSKMEPTHPTPGAKAGPAAAPATAGAGRSGSEGIAVPPAAEESESSEDRFEEAVAMVAREPGAPTVVDAGLQGGKPGKFFAAMQRAVAGGEQA